jgi:tetratricopeptide (TPR) repeat protein
VVHRDVKPSNLMIDPSGRVWVTDFGLAQLESDATLTMSGDILGTLRYMSPEQSLGKPGLVDFRTDIYSLGATLYEMLTLQPLFPEADRQAILACIANNEPRSLRWIDPDIPADLETIVTKALSKEPLDRYATAGEMAEDLRRFLTDVPIRAKRPTRVERAIKWVRRHHRIVTVASMLVALMLCLVVVGMVLLATAWRRESHQRQLAEDAAKEATAKTAEAEAESARAERNFRRALQAVDEMFTQVGVSDLVDVPQKEPVRRALVQKALEYYQGFLKERPDDPELAYETGRAWVRVGYARRILGELPGALQAAQQAKAIFDSLDAEHSANPDHRLGLMSAYEEIAMNQMMSNQRVDALETRRKALELMEAIVRDFPEPAHHWIRLADAMSAYGNSFNLTGHSMSEAEPYHRRSLATLEQVRERYPEEDLLAQFAHKSHWLGDCLVKQKKYEEAEVYLRRAIELREEQLRRTPGSAGVKHDLAHAISYYSHIPIPRGHEAEREAILKRNIEVTKQLSRDFPDTLDFANRLTMAYRGYGNFLQNYGRYAESRDLHLEYILCLKQLQKRFPLEGGQLGNIAWAYNTLGTNLTELGEKDAAREAYQEARRNFEQLIVAVPNHMRAKWYLAVFLAECSDEQVGDAARGRDMIKSIVAEAPDRREHWMALAAAEHRLRNWQAMREALERSAALAKEPVPVTEQLGLAIALSQLGEKDAALQMYQSAVAEIDRLSIHEYDVRKILEEARTLLGVAE